MCGLVGIASTEGFKERDRRAAIFEESLVLSSFRGWESTGVALVEKGKENLSPTIYKRALTASDFIQSHFFGNQVVKRMDDYSMVMGHCRSSTRGLVTTKNAHPFQHGAITLTHNGTIENIHMVMPYTKAEVPDDMIVDSDKLAWLMNREGDEEVLKKLEGPYALVWHNAKDGTLNFCRNDKKPLFWAYLKGENTMIWASEPTLILHVCERRALELEVAGKEQAHTFYPKPHHIVTFHPKNFREYTSRPFVPSQLSGPPGRRFEDGRGRNGGTDPPWSLGLRRLTDRSAVEHAVREGLKSATPRSPGRPTKPSKIDKANESLSKFGYKVDDWCIVTPETWIAYKNQQELYGLVLGRTQVGQPVCMYHVHRDTYKKYRETEKIWCRTVNVTTLQGSNSQTMVVTEDPDSDRKAKEWAARGSLPAKDNTVDETPHPLERIYKGARGQMLSQDRFLELTMAGCSWCSGALALRDHEKIVWFDDNSPLCPNCQEDPEVRETLGLQESQRIMH